MSNSDCFYLSGTVIKYCMSIYIVNAPFIKDSKLSIKRQRELEFRQRGAPANVFRRSRSTSLHALFGIFRFQHSVTLLHDSWVAR
eukprot:3128314-Amphidinium_carterae.2